MSSVFSSLGLRIAVQSVKERTALLDLLLWGALLLGHLLLLAGMRERALSLLSQAHRSGRSPKLRWLAEIKIFENLDVYQAPPKADRPGIEPYLGKRVIVLKPACPGGERGVILVKFSELLKKVAAGFDLPRLMRDYHIVFEPSWSGYCDRDLLFYSRFSEPVFFLAAERDDYDFLRRLNKNLVPVDLGPCDWVDPTIAEPFLGLPKQYDIVMNSNWGSWKRHYVLFSAMRQLPKTISVALIGFEWGGKTADHIRELARHYGVLDQLTLFERIPYEKVMEINCRSKMAILLSLKEGSNRAVAESFFCDIPAIVLAEHVGGIVKNIVPATGQLVPERNLADGIAQMLANLGRYSPRAWAIDNVSYIRSTQRLNEQLRQAAFINDEPWTTDIVCRSNSPELRYVDAADARRLQPWNAALADYLC